MSFITFVLYLVLLNVLSQEVDIPKFCEIDNGKCTFVYRDSKCMHYDDETDNPHYYDLHELSLSDINKSCSEYWQTQYSINWQQQCSNIENLVWPVGKCGCPRCDCPASLCCYNNIAGEFNLNNWHESALKIPCDNEEDMCLYTIDSNNKASVACSSTSTADNTLSMNINDDKSNILNENNNVACYTFIDNNITSSHCFCKGNGCNNLHNIQAPDLKEPPECYITDSFENEEYWIDYIRKDNSCAMCAVSISEFDDNSQVKMKCSSRQNCYSLLTKYDAYNDELKGCVVTANSTTTHSNISNISMTITECCCDPSIDGNLCNSKFVSREKRAGTLECWKTAYLDISNTNWKSGVSPINCSTEFYDYCYIESFGGNIYSSNCATKSFCNNQNNTKSNIMCCNDTDYCNQPSLFFEPHQSSVSRLSLLFCCFLTIFFVVIF